MRAFIIVGNTGRGKSTSARKLLHNAKNAGKKIIVYDPNAEYKEFYSSDFLSVSAFMDKVKNEKNAFILFEEATIFFSNRGYNDILVDLLVRKRHSNNEIVLLFHSLRSIPTYILELCNFLILYKTTDRENYISKTFEGFDEILAAYKILSLTNDKTRDNFHKNIIIELNKPVAYI